MKIFSNIWKYLTFLLAGLTAGMVAAIKMIDKPSVLNVSAENFVAEQTQKIGKLKQRGEGNSQDVSMPPELPARKERRLARRATRRESRLKKETGSKTEEEKQEQKHL